MAAINEEENPLKELTVDKIEQWKKDVHRNRVMSQAKDIYRTIKSWAEEEKRVKYIQLNGNYVYPENSALLNKNGFRVYKVTLLHNESKSYVQNYVAWGDVDFETVFSKWLYDGNVSKEWQILECTRAEQAEK